MILDDDPKVGCIIFISFVDQNIQRCISSPRCCSPSCLGISSSKIIPTTDHSTHCNFGIQFLSPRSWTFLLVSIPQPHRKPPQSSCFLLEFEAHTRTSRWCRPRGTVDELLAGQAPPWDLLRTGPRPSSLRQRAHEEADCRSVYRPRHRCFRFGEAWWPGLACQGALAAGDMRGCSETHRSFLPNRDFLVFSCIDASEDIVSHERNDFLALLLFPRWLTRHIIILLEWHLI